jgi:hypothetical protein
MVERTCVLCRQLGAGEDREELVSLMARAVCERLAGELKEGLSPEDCGEVFALAAALMVLELLDAVGGEDGMTALSVGEVSMRFSAREGLGKTARGLLAPYLRSAFAVMEVAG